MIDDLPTDRARLALIDSLVKMRREYEFNERESEHLFGLVEAIAKDPKNPLNLAAQMIAPARQSGSLGKALRGTFPHEHAIWGYVKWV